jgi:integrase
MAAGINRLTDLNIKSWITKARAGKVTAGADMAFRTTGGGTITVQKGAVVKQPKLSDGGGLFVTLTKKGTAVFRITYRYGGKTRLFSVGIYPEVSLEAARRERELLKADLKAGRDPVQVRMIAKAANVASADTTFAGVAAEWLAKRKKEWSEIHYEQTKHALERDIFPKLGSLPIGEITAPILAREIEKVNKRTEQTAAKILWSVKGIFQLAQTRDGATIRENPAIAVRAVLTNSTPRKPRAALLTFPALGDVLRRTDGAAISPAVRLCLKLIAFTAVRVSNGVEAQWKEFDLDADVPTWTIPREQMKVSKGRPFDHTVLLGPTIAAELKHWQRVTGGRGFLFPSPHHDNEHITSEACEKFYRMTLKLRDIHSVHGWRSSFSTLANDHGFASKAVDLALDHVNESEVERAYNRPGEIGGKFEERVRMAYWWDSQLSAAQHGGTVLPLRATAS